MDLEELGDYYKENKPLSYAFIAIGLLAVGVIADFILNEQMNGNNLRGVVSIFMSIIGCFIVLLDVVIERQEEKANEAYLASVSIKDADKAEARAEKAEGLLETLTAEHDKALLEIEALRKTDKQRTLSIQKVKEEKENLESELEKVKAHNQNLLTENQQLNIEKQKVEVELQKVKEVSERARKSFEAVIEEYTSFAEAGKLYASYKANKSIAASNAYTEEEREGARAKRDREKEELDTFADSINNA